jgi:beta-lactamase superfamily II metal-dependent hydrolase
MVFHHLLRPLLVFIGVFSVAVAAGNDPAPAAVAGSPLPLWTEGCLDIHHINAGRGEAAFLILPDGTTLLVDAGAAPAEAGWTTPPKPDDSRQPGEWMARYIAHMLQRFPTKQIDQAVISHFHIDHMGAISPASRVSASGAYQLGGLTEIGDYLPIRRMFDRNWPDYNWPLPLEDLKMQNYRKFLAWQTANRGMRVERFAAGRNDQLGLLHDKARYPEFEIRNIAVNGEVWTGVAAVTRNHFPPLSSLAPMNYPSENKCCIAFRISYGKFDYFTGGDLDVRDVELAGPADQWKDIERPVALVTGPVDVYKVNHHANYDANSPFFLSILRPRVSIASTWGASQPAMPVHRRLLSSATYPGPRDVFYTNMMQETLAALHVDKIKTPTGHIVVRVMPGGAEYFVYVLDDTDESYRIKAVFGPYQSG